MSPSSAGQLQRSAPEEQSVASAAILEFVEALNSQVQEVHSFMLLRHGSVIAEGWWMPYGNEYPHQLFSLSKSFTSTAVGLAVSEGYFSIDDPVVSFFPDEAPADGSELLAALQVRHLLSMNTGQDADTWSFMVDRPDGDWIKGFFSVPVLHAPGTHFVYNTGATYMLSAIVQKTTGMKVVDYLAPRLFQPLGITNAAWRDSPQGITAGGIGLSLKTEDVARFGQLYLQHGRWQGQQVIPEAWIAEATAFQSANGDDPNNDWAQGYGYQFWHCRHGAYRGDGVFGQYCIVMPEQDAVLAITAAVDVFDAQPVLNLVWEKLLPAMRPQPLPDDIAAQAKLAEQLSALAHKPAQGTASSALAAQISGRPYRADPNELQIETITLVFAGGEYTVRVKTAAGEEVLTAGCGAWQRGQTSLFAQPLLFDRAAFAASGAWTAEDSFMLLVRLYETPFYHTLVFHFAEDELILEAQINVSLESMKPLVLTARQV